MFAGAVPFCSVLRRQPASTPSTRILDVDPPSAPGRDLPRGIVDEWVRIVATLVRHDDAGVLGMLRYRLAGEGVWEHAPLLPRPERRFEGAFLPDRPGRWEVQIDAWTNRWAAWRDDISTKVQGAGQADYANELLAARALLEEFRQFAYVGEMLEYVEEVGDQTMQLAMLLGVEALPDQHELVSLPCPFVVAVDPEAARSGSWLELPAGAKPSSLRRVAATGFDTVLVPAPVALGSSTGPARDALAHVTSLAPAADAAGLRLALRVTVGDGLDALEGTELDSLCAELVAWVVAGIRSFEVEGAARVPLPVWDAVLAEVLRQEPAVIFSAAGPLPPALAHGLGLVGFAQQSAGLALVPTRSEAELLATGSLRSLTSPSPWRRLVASGGGPLVAAAMLSPGCGFGVVDPSAGALSLARRLVNLRRDWAPLRPDAELRFLDTEDDRTLAFLRCARHEELLIVLSRDAAAAIETTVTLPAEAASPDTFDALDLLGGTYRRLSWRTGACPALLPPGGALVLRLDR